MMMSVSSSAAVRKMIGTFDWVAYTAFALTLVLFLHLTGIDPLPADAPILQQ